MGDERRDLIVFGSGTAGRLPAIACADAGWRVLVIDPRPPGGTCPNRGCDAKKPYVNVAAAHAAAHDLAGRGLAEPAAVDWPALHRFKTRFTAPVPDDTREALAAAGVELAEQRGRFVDEQTVELDDGRRLQADKFVLATGLRPRPLAMPGAELLTTSDQFLELATLPPRVAFVGGGYIAMEFAHAAIRAGVEVTIVEQQERVLTQADEALSRAAAAASQAAGIELRCEACVDRIERVEPNAGGGEPGGAAGLRVICSDSDWSCEADLVVHGAGRVANVEGLGLEQAGVEVDERGVVIDEHFRSPGNPRVYAAGDVSGSPGLELTPVSGAEGRAVRDNLLHGDVCTVEQALAPATATCVFMIPPLASVGLTQAQAAERHGEDALAISSADAGDWKLFAEFGREHAYFKIIAHRRTRALLGAHLLMPGADELINLFALAMTAKLPVDDLRRPLYVYPTLAGHLDSMLAGID